MACGDRERTSRVVSQARAVREVLRVLRVCPQCRFVRDPPLYGIATLRHAQRIFIPNRGDGLVALGDPVGASVFGWVDLSSPPIEPIDLRLPAIGALQSTVQ